MVSSILSFKDGQTAARHRLTNFGRTNCPGNLMTLVPPFGGTLRRNRDQSGKSRKKRAAVSGGF